MKNKGKVFYRMLELPYEACREDENLMKLRREYLTEELLKDVLEYIYDMPIRDMPNFSTSVETKEISDGRNGRPFSIKKTAVLYIPEGFDCKTGHMGD